MSNDVKWKSAGEKLRVLRKKTGLSIFKVAKNIHVSGNYLSMIERGSRAPSDVVLHNIAEFYNVDRDELFSLYDKVQPSTLSNIVANPHLRKLVTQLSTDKRLTSEDFEDIALQISKVHDELFDTK